jgi:LPS O-antigen subunit length determinant protein (WzzB/FepE family)
MLQKNIHPVTPKEKLLVAMGYTIGGLIGLYLLWIIASAIFGITFTYANLF